MPFFFPDAVYIEQRVLSLVHTQEILSNLQGTPVHIVSHLSEVVSKKPLPSDKILILAKQEGKFLKPCPCTKNHICCGYYFINLATNCPIGCTYCILQGYLNNPYLTVYTNLDDLFTELDETKRSFRKKFFRIGTGELTDSLILDHLTGHSRKLISYFANWHDALFELKTKTTQIQHLPEKPPPSNNIVISWSLNPARIIREEEKHAPLLEERIMAAATCLKAGYGVGFHFDPLIHYPEWEKEYKTTVKILFDQIPADKIAWISLGALRYPAKMDKIIRTNHPESSIVLGELFPGKDGKYRYFRPIREQMYRTITAYIRSLNRAVPLYLCMESQSIWSKVLSRHFSSDIFRRTNSSPSLA
ncbi:MAG: hypothetical protein JW774_13540 [Candidatus Aureabacteria bacterium]|nr:hypothetical protein [Candidatus Auribacterota bacterium]